LIAEAPPAPPPAARRVAPRRVPRPAPPPVAPPPPAPVEAVAAVAEPVPGGSLPDAPGESETAPSTIEATAPAVPAPDPALVEPKPAETQTAGAGELDLAAELSEIGGTADALPAAGSYVYTMSDSRYSALTGTTTIEWKRDPATERYESRLRSTVFGITLADISSQGSIRRSGVAPERYVQKTATRAPQAANLDWERNIVTFSARSYQRSLRAGTQDRLSFQFQLMALAQRLPNALRTGATLAMDVAGPGDVESYHFLVVGPETVETANGPIEAIKLDRSKTGPGDARIEVWLAPARRYLPVRLRFTDRRGNVTESLLESADEGG
jgi:hypothetical protein